MKSGRSFGMPQELAPLRSWYEQGRCAVVANVGTLARPVSKAEFKAGVGLPAKLFSHNDQAATWQSLQPEGAPTGWGGRMGDILMAANQQPVFTAVSASGNAVFLSGNQVTQYQVGANGPVQINGAQAGWRAGSTLALATDALAKQLRVVAQLIAAGPGLGMKRQVFMVQIGGFDSHSNQMRDQPLLMARVAQSVNWFLGAMQAQGLLNKVLLFTASDFGRTLASNGDGCDHGWGGHHLVAGGSVKGREIYGSMPITALGTNDDLGSGRLLPSTSVTQYAATRGAWMGLSAAELRSVLPNLGEFSTGNLGFV